MIHVLILILGYALFVALDLNIAIRTQNMMLITDCLTDLGLCLIATLLLIIVWRLTYENH